MNSLSIALFLAVVNKAIIAYVTDPIKRKFPLIDYWFLTYVALVTGAVIGWIAQVNLFPVEALPNVMVGRILTAIVIGGGSSLIHDIFDKGQ